MRSKSKKSKNEGVTLLHHLKWGSPIKRLVKEKNTSPQGKFILLTKHRQNDELRIFLDKS